MAELTPDLLLRAYSVGVFPMAESADSPVIYWFDPEQRGILPLDAFHIPRSLRRTVRRTVFEVRVNTAFEAVIDGCAERTLDRQSTWINAAVRRAYSQLAATGFAHSVECWLDNRLVGGLYGVAIGGAFFGESMFSRVTDASKVALVHLVARLRHGGFRLLDTQFVTPHLIRFGAREVPRGAYRKLLAAALSVDASFGSTVSETALVSSLLQSMTQTS